MLEQPPKHGVPASSVGKAPRAQREQPKIAPSGKREQPEIARPRSWSMASVATAGLFICMIAQLVVLAFDPIGFAHIAPILLVLLIAACRWLVIFVGSFGALAKLVRDRRVRVVHGLEHATANVLELDGIRMLQGRTARGFFLLELGNDGRTSVEAVRRAVEQAVARVAGGEAKLALHPRCGTSLLLAATLLSLLAVASTAIGVIRGVPAEWIVLWTAGMALVICGVSRPAGMWAQRLLTVSTRFASATIGAINHQVAANGRSAVFLVPVAVELA